MPLQPLQCAEEECSLARPQRFSLGPEIYHVERLRQGGTKQEGWNYGLRATYERIKYWGIYWGIEALYAKGHLTGHSGNLKDKTNTIKSNFTDEEVEGSLGFTFQSLTYYQAAFTPILGGGYFRESNRYCKPLGLNGLKFQIRYPYGMIGFICSARPLDCLRVGLTFKAKAMWHAQCHVTGDPELAEAALGIGDRVNYRIEVPFIYLVQKFCDHWEAGLVPFYEWRHYGGQENFPSDFFDTRIQIYGLRLEVCYRY